VVGFENLIDSWILTVLVLFSWRATGGETVPFSRSAMQACDDIEETRWQIPMRVPECLHIFYGILRCVNVAAM